MLPIPNISPPPSPAFQHGNVSSPPPAKSPAHGQREKLYGPSNYELFTSSTSRFNFSPEPPPLPVHDLHIPIFQHLHNFPFAHLQHRTNLIKMPPSIYHPCQLPLPLHNSLPLSWHWISMTPIQKPLDNTKTNEPSDINAP